MQTALTLVKNHPGLVGISLRGLLPGVKSEYLGDVAEYMEVSDQAKPSVLIDNPASGTPIGLVGRVPVIKVVNLGGVLIKRGDFVTTSDTPGPEMKATPLGRSSGMRSKTRSSVSSATHLIIFIGANRKPKAPC